MKIVENLLDEENERILDKLDDTIGLSKNKDLLRDIIRYHKVMEKYKCNIEYENYNIVIRNDSAYNLYEELISVIGELYYKNKITLHPGVKYLTRNNLKIGRLKNEDLCNIEEGLIVLDFTNNTRMEIKEERKLIDEMIEKMPTKSFIILENLFIEGEINAIFTDHFSWAMKIDSIAKEEKERYILSFMNKNKLVCEQKIIQAIANEPYYKIKNILLNILVDCKIKQNNDVATVIGKEEKKEDVNKNKKTGIEELDGLIGLDDVKEQIKMVINYIKVSRNRAQMPMLHMCFNGNPGTGKTTVARIIGKIFAEEKILSEKRIFVEAQRGDLIGKYVGHTAPQTQEIIDKAKGGVLFIDEAYSIASYIEDEAGRDFGAECIATVLKGMEDNRNDLCVILAGYTNEMKHMLEANPGFESRIQFQINFPDYNEEELYTIFKGLCKNEKYKLSSNIKKTLIKHFEIAKQNENFANARYVRSLFEKIKIEQANRVTKENDDLSLIKVADILNAIEKTKKVETKQKRRIGFVA